MSIRRINYLVMVTLSSLLPLTPATGAYDQASAARMSRQVTKQVHQSLIEGSGVNVGGINSNSLLFSLTNQLAALRNSSRTPSATHKKTTDQMLGA